MAEFLDTTARITSEIEKLINESQGEKLVLLTPYLKIARQFQNLIEDQNKFKTTISVIVREGESHNPAEISFLQKMKFVSLYTHENLHAKCYLNQKTAIITSMNLYEYSQLNNTELGIKVDKEIDKELYEKINETVKRIIRNSREFEFEIKKVDKSKGKREINPLNPGYCIHCGTQIEFNLNKPLCLECYHKLGNEYNRKSPERFCLACGKNSFQTFEKPICQTCEKNKSK